MPSLMNFHLPRLARTAGPTGPAAPEAVLRDDRRIFADGHAKKTLLLHLAEPLAQATGTAMLLKAADKASAGGDASVHVAAFALTSLLLPNLLRRAATVEQKRWLSQSQRAYDKSFVTHDKDRPALWAMNKADDAQGAQDQRSARTYLFAERLRWGIFNEVNGACELSRAALEVGVAMVLFSTTLGPDVALAFAAGAVLLTIFNKSALTSVVQRNDAMTTAGGALDAHLRRYYDNVELGNQNNYARWQQTFAALTADVAALRMKQAKSDAVRSLVVLGLVRAPVVVALALRYATPAEREAKAQVGRDILLQLPYLFAVGQRVVAASELLGQRFVPARSALATSLHEARQTPALDLHAYIAGDAIGVRGPFGQTNFTQAWPELLAAARGEGCGRFTLTGDNGKGKSMALLALKQALAADASMLVPADLKELSFPRRQGSSGERVYDALLAGLRQGPRTLLLDEWEAHLDATRRTEFGAVLQRISMPTEQGGDGRVVVEIRHQPPQE